MAKENGEKMYLNYEKRIFMNVIIYERIYIKDKLIR